MPKDNKDSLESSESLQQNKPIPIPMGTPMLPIGMTIGSVIGLAMGAVLGDAGLGGAIGYGLGAAIGFALDVRSKRKQQ
jgi:hypothetical protein